MSIQFCTKANLPAHFGKYVRCVSIKWLLLVPLQPDDLVFQYNHPIWPLCHRRCMEMTEEHLAPLLEEVLAHLEVSTTTPRVFVQSGIDAWRQHQRINLPDGASSFPLCPTAVQRHAFKSYQNGIQWFPSSQDMGMCQTLHFLSCSLVGCSKETRVVDFKMTTCGTEVYIVRAVWLLSFSNVKCHPHESDIWKVMLHLFRLLRTVLRILAVARGDHRNNRDKGRCWVTTQTEQKTKL